MAYENGSWVSEGTVINYATVGATQGSVVADGTAIELSDGRVRVYLFANDGVQAVVSSDGKTFISEGATSLPTGSGMPKVEAIDTGYRIYYQQGDGILSATSSDGITFTQEDGTRLAYATATSDGSKISAPSLATINGTTYGYYGDVDAVAGSGRFDHATFAAVTTDGVTFSTTGTPLIGVGSSLGNTAEHPDALENPDGTVTVFYSDNTVGGQQGGVTSIWHSTTSDGTTFTTEVDTGITGNDPFVIRTTDGTLRLYAGDFSSTDGGFYRSAVWVENVATATTASSDTIVGSGYSNRFSGAAGDDRLTGAGGADIVYGNTGLDLIYGNRGLDSLFGGQDADTVFGGQEADAVYGNLGDDVVYGNFGDDAVFGGQGNDTLYGGQGADTLNGNLGDDLLIGNLGSDSFRFGSGSGSDTISGFADGADAIAIASNANGNGITDFAGISAAMTTVNGTDTQIDLGSGNAILVTGVLPSQLDSADFSFF